MIDYIWERVFQSQFVPQINAIVDVLERRLLPNFEAVDAEADSIADEAWNRFMSMPATGEEDAADFAESAMEEGLSHFMLMDGLRQGMLNLFAATLYHAFEQQIILFFRREYLHQEKECGSGQFNLSVVKGRLKNFGVDITKFASWPKINELRLVANTVKHAEGNSSQRLYKIRPNMFSHPRLLQFGLQDDFTSSEQPQVFQPLVGEGLYVSVQDVKDYRDQLVRFWQEFADAK